MGLPVLVMMKNKKNLLALFQKSNLWFFDNPFVNFFKRAHQNFLFSIIYSLGRPQFWNLVYDFNRFGRKYLFFTGGVVCSKTLILQIMAKDQNGLDIQMGQQYSIEWQCHYTIFYLMAMPIHNMQPFTKFFYHFWPDLLEPYIRL